MKISRKKNPPSIQDPKSAYGFEEGNNGELVPQAPPDKDPTLGPAYYNAVCILQNTSKIYHSTSYLMLFVKKNLIDVQSTTFPIQGYTLF